MARQSTTAVSFQRSIRKDTSVLMTSARAGVVVPVGFVPLHAGDTCAGRVGIDVELKEMPRPLLNAVTANFQAWFVPKSAHPQFFSRAELNHARTGGVIKQLGAADREPPPFFYMASGAPVVLARDSQFFRTLGLHVPVGAPINTDLLDAFTIIYNFRLAAHSSRLPRRFYFDEDVGDSTYLPPAFWPSSRFSRVVPDYEQALITGALDLDVIAGRLAVRTAAPADVPSGTNQPIQLSGVTPNRDLHIWQAAGLTQANSVFAEMAGTTVLTSLADVDKARVTQAFAKLRTAYAGNDSTGFDNDDTIVSLLMQGIGVPEEDFKRPWLLDSKRVAVGFAERHATDGASLDASVTLGRASAVLALNVPLQDVSGVIIFTVEVLPERLDERMSDEWLLATTVNDLPNALRDVQRTLPVDLVLNRRVDTAHSNPDYIYGYEPMNDKWNRDFTRLGGEFFQPLPGTGFVEARSAIWQTEIVDPFITVNHYLAPYPFPHAVFSNVTGDAFECVCRHACTISGLTQIGDVLAENNDDYDAVSGVVI